MSLMGSALEKMATCGTLTARADVATMYPWKANWVLTGVFAAILPATGLVY